MAINICHNITTVQGTNGVTYEGNSPDELALIEATQAIGIQLTYRDREKLVISIRDLPEAEQYTILQVFPFTSVRKRMGIIVRKDASNQILFLLKGADTIMKSIVKPEQRAEVEDQSNLLASEGLRTLVFGYKPVSEEDYRAWLVSNYQNDDLRSQAGQGAAADIVSQLEQNMELLGITGVEDQLQDGLNEALQSFRKAGIQMWMLTGDKQQTAISIAQSCGLINASHQQHVMSELTELGEFDRVLARASQNIKKTVLIIDGLSFQLGWLRRKQELMDIAMHIPCVVFCRCSPLQKSQIVEAIIQSTEKVVCAVGDGGNDVSMIQNASVGVGIVGKEGMQAALASDFSITQFKHLTKLIFWHGRLSYKRTALLSQFICHRGMLIAFIVFVFSCFFYFISLHIFNGTLIVCLTTVFTVVPTFLLVLDSDSKVKTIMENPRLYGQLQLGREMNLKIFLSWVASAVYQGTAIMVFTLYFLRKYLEYVTIQTVAFSSLLFTEYIMLIFEMKTINKIQVACTVLSIGLYALIWLYLYEFFEIRCMTRRQILWKTVAIVAINYVPIRLIKWVIRKFLPTQLERFKKERRKSEK